jgi:glucose/arabinose dehydrogenase
MRMTSGVVLALVLAGAPAAPARAQLLRSSTRSRAVEVGRRLHTPTAFAFGAGRTFVADAGSQDGSNAGGGVYVLVHGSPRRIAGSPPAAYGVAWRRGTLYVSAASTLLAWSGWTGSRFASMTTIYTAPAGFTRFNGIGFGADGRLYAGVGLAVDNDHSPTSAPYAFDVLSFNARGSDLRVVARGLRQPWQMAFPTGSSAPFVSVLGQDFDPSNPPDYVVRVRPGEDFGFPECNWVVAQRCSDFAKPFKLLAPHASPMGLAISGGRLYLALYGGLGHGPEVASMRIGGGAIRPVLTGFTQPIVALGIDRHHLLVGEVSGQIFRVSL